MSAIFHRIRKTPISASAFILILSLFGTGVKAQGTITYSCGALNISGLRRLNATL